jgi:hypothetical protein
MTNTNTRRALCVLWGTLACMLSGCPEADNLFVRHFFRPLDMAVVCMGDDGKGTDLSGCEDGTGTLVGFVANAERPGLSWVNLRTGDFKDLNKFIPSYNPVPVGGRSVAMVAATNGEAVYTANFSDATLTRIHTTSFERFDQALSGRPAAIIQVGDSLVVGLHPMEDATGAASAQLIRFPMAKFGETAVVEAVDLPGFPHDLVLDAAGETLYVGYVGQAFVSTIDLATFSEVVEARVGLADECFDDFDNNGDGWVDSADHGCRTGDVEAEEPSGWQAPDVVLLSTEPSLLPQCMNQVDDNGDGLTDYPDDGYCVSATDSVEAPRPPVLVRLALSSDGAFLYAINARDVTVVVIDVATSERVDVNAEGMVGANALFRTLGFKDIVLQSYEAPLDLAIVDMTVTDDDGEESQQMVAYVTSATGKVIIIDVTDDNGTPVHRFRDGDSGDESIPFAPRLFVADEEIELGSSRRKDMPSFGEYVANKPIESSGETSEKTHYGIQVLGDPRLVRNEYWNVTYRGALVARTVPLAMLNVSSEVLRLETPEVVFCDHGVEAGDQVVLNSPANESCAVALFDTVAFTIVSVHEQFIELEPGSGEVLAASTSDEATLVVGDSVSDDVLACYSAAVEYEVRVPQGTYAVIGSASGFRHPWTTDETGLCVIDLTLDPTLTQGRMKEWVLKEEASIPICPLTDAMIDTYLVHPDNAGHFENHAFRVRMIPGCIDGELLGEYVIVPTQVDVRWRFLMDSAFEIQALGNLGTPRRLHWQSSEQRVYIVDSGLERVVSITPGPDKVVRADFY